MLLADGGHSCSGITHNVGALSLRGEKKSVRVSCLCVLEVVSHPFLANLHYAFQTPKNLLNRESSVGWLCKHSDADLCTSVIGRRLEQLTLHFVGQM